MRVFKKLLMKIFFRLERSAWEATYLQYRKKYQLSPTFRFNGKGIVFYGEGTISIGNNTYIGEYSTLQSSEGASIVIGDNCAISHYVSIYTLSYSANAVLRGDMKTNKKGDVTIGNGCWIGMRVFIKEGVKIGNNCVIGANSVVTSDIPDNSLAIGVPAKVVRRYNSELGQISYERNSWN